MSTSTPVAPADARRRRLRLYTIFGLAAIAGLELLTTTQSWWTLRLAGHTIAVQGTVAAAALSALALTSLALAAALAIAGPVFRFILGLLQLLIAFTVTFTSIVSLAEPARQSAALVTTATGVAGETSIEKLILGTTYTAWGFVAVGIGVLAFLAGLWLLFTVRHWPTASRKYQPVQFAHADGTSSNRERDAVIDWDSLSEGDDPTEDGAAAPRAHTNATDGPVQ